MGANTVSLPLEHSFLSGGANGIRGWRLRELGPGNLNPENVNVVVEGLGDLQAMLSMEWRSHWVSPWDLTPGSSTLETFGCMGRTHLRRRNGATRGGAVWP